jgi:hypothetical protein
VSVRRRGNGLTAESYVRLIDVDPRLADHLLVALASANVAAYTTPSAGRTGPTLELHLPTRPLEVVHVDSTRRPAARRVLEATMPDMTVGLPTVEEEDQFAALIAAWDEEPANASWPAAEDTEPAAEDVTGPPRRRKTDRRPVDATEAPEAPADESATPAIDDSSAVTDTTEAPDETSSKDTAQTARPDIEDDEDRGAHSRVIRISGPSFDKTPRTSDERADADADGDAAAEDDDTADDDAAEDHYVPPPLPPLPPAHPVTKWGVVALLFGLLLLVAPTMLGLQHTTSVNLLGVLSILGAVGLLVSRLSDRSTDDYDGPDDGAVV